MIRSMRKRYHGYSHFVCLNAFVPLLWDFSATYDVVVYIGHNGLMDFNIPMPNKTKDQVREPDCVVLCCKSEQYFKQRINEAGGRPILLTSQFMYPGSFILHAIVDDWISRKPLSAIRSSAGAAYAKNQNISKKAGIGVFAEIKENNDQINN